MYVAQMVFIYFGISKGYTYKNVYNLVFKHEYKNNDDNAYTHI